MTRAEATARVLAAARGMAHRFVREFGRRWPEVAAVERALDALDACPPDDTDAVVGMWRDLHDARALAWAGGKDALRLRNSEHKWWLAFESGHDGDFGTAHNGWWPTRDAEHAKAVADRVSNAQWEKHGWARPIGMASNPVGEHKVAPSNDELRAQFDALVREAGQTAGVPLAVPASTVEQRLAALETAVMGHECAGPAELIDSARLDALAAQVADVGWSVRQIASRLDAEPALRIGGYHEAVLVKCGGPDAKA